MPGKSQRTSAGDLDLPDLNVPDSVESRNPFDPSLVDQMKAIVAAGLTPSSALDLVIRLIAEVPAASKEAMDQIKLLDKLINTARGMIETKLKSEEAAAIALRLDYLEHRIQDLIAVRLSDCARSAEVWNDTGTGR